MKTLKIAYDQKIRTKLQRLWSDTNIKNDIISKMSQKSSNIEKNRSTREKSNSEDMKVVSKTSHVNTNENNVVKNDSKLKISRHINSIKNMNSEVDLSEISPLNSHNLNLNKIDYCSSEKSSNIEENQSNSVNLSCDNIESGENSNININNNNVVRNDLELNVNMDIDNINTTHSEVNISKSSQLKTDSLNSNKINDLSNSSVNNSKSVSVSDYEEMEKKNFNRIEMVRDGACAFRAFSWIESKTQNNHPEMRRQVVEYLDEHWNIYKEQIEAGIYSGKGKTVYLDDMSKPSFFASEIEIVIYHVLYQKNLKLMEISKTKKKNVYSDSSSQRQRK